MFNDLYENLYDLIFEDPPRKCLPCPDQRMLIISINNTEQVSKIYSLLERDVAVRTELGKPDNWPIRKDFYISLATVACQKNAPEFAYRLVENSAAWGASPGFAGEQRLLEVSVDGLHAELNAHIGFLLACTWPPMAAAVLCSVRMPYGAALCHPCCRQDMSPRIIRTTPHRAERFSVPGLFVWLAAINYADDKQQASQLTPQQPTAASVM